MRSGVECASGTKFFPPKRTLKKTHSLTHVTSARQWRASPRPSSRFRTFCRSNYTHPSSCWCAHRRIFLMALLAATLARAAVSERCSVLECVCVSQSFVSYAPFAAVSADEIPLSPPTTPPDSLAYPSVQLCSFVTFSWNARRSRRVCVLCTRVKRCIPFRHSLRRPIETSIASPHSLRFRLHALHRSFILQCELVIYSGEGTNCAHTRTLTHTHTH